MAGAFVSPKWVPQMADSAEVFRRIRQRPNVSYPVQVPNVKGTSTAWAAPRPGASQSNRYT